VPFDARPRRFWFGLALAVAAAALITGAGVLNARLVRERREELALRIARTVAASARESPDSTPSLAPEAARAPRVALVRILKGATWVSHSDATLMGTRLSRDSLEDKAAFDRAQRLKARVEDNEEALRRAPALGRRPYPEYEVDLRADATHAAVPVVIEGRFVAMVEVRLRPPGFGMPILQFADSEVRSRWVALAIAALILLLSVFFAGERGGFRRLARTVKENLFAYTYITPVMLGMIVLVFFPLLYGVGLGFFTRKYNQWEFAGLANFIQILSDTRITQAGSFYFKLGVTLLWTVANVFLHVVIGLGLALMLRDSAMKLRGVYRVLLIVPWAVPNYITALIWKGMFHKQFGAVNAGLAAVGVEPVSWFNSFGTAFLANLATNTWLGFPFMMVISLGALQSIPQDLYEAADVDGATRWQKFRHITLPLLMPALFPAIVLGTIWTFNMFNIIYLVSGGAPDGATDILITDAFRWAFERDQYGYAAAYSTVIFLILLAFTLSTNRVTKATEGVYG
jgi:ABC-type sugar transport system permease subunit